jgi:hypothetical protein
MIACHATVSPRPKSAAFYPLPCPFIALVDNVRQFIFLMIDTCQEEKGAEWTGEAGKTWGEGYGGGRGGGWGREGGRGGGDASPHVVCMPPNM